MCDSKGHIMTQMLQKGHADQNVGHNALQIINIISHPITSFLG